jgi:hypothetical protein
MKQKNLIFFSVFKTSEKVGATFLQKMKNGKNGQKRDDFFSHFLGKNLPICYYFSQFCALFCFCINVFNSSNSILVRKIANCIYVAGFFLQKNCKNLQIF